MGIMRAAVTLTHAEAAQVLEPPLSERQLRDIVRALGWQPSGHRHTGRPGKPVAVYDWAKITRLHAALAEFSEVSLRYVPAAACPDSGCVAFRMPGGGHG